MTIDLILPANPLLQLILAIIAILILVALIRGIIDIIF